MTVVPSWDIDGLTDAELARAAASGDRRALAGIYDRYADRLHDFCAGMLRDRDGAADCVQDAFCTAASRLTQLREPDKLRPWLYAIARNEALRRLRERRRETPFDEMPDTVSNVPGPDTLAARTELADLIAEAAGGLSDRDRSVYELAYRHGLDGPELANALGVSPGNANKMVYRLRETIKHSLGALLVSRRARNMPDGCFELVAILDGWDGRFSVLMRKRIARHIESCVTCDEERRRLVSPAALLGAVPVFIPAPAWLRGRTLTDVRLDAPSTPFGSADSGQAGKVDAAGDRVIEARRHRRNVLPVALFVAALIASLGLTIAWLNQPDTAIIPADMTDTAPLPASTTPSAPPTPGNPLPAPTASVATTIPSITTPRPPVVPPVRPPAPPELPPPAPPEPPPPAPPEPPPPPPSDPDLQSDPEPPVQPPAPPEPPPPAAPPRLVPEPPPQAPEQTSVIPELGPQTESPSLHGPITQRQLVPSISPPH